jgi:hypothetical protein
VALERSFPELDATAQADLLRILTSPRDLRAAIIGRMYAEPATRALAERLIDLEIDEVAHLQAIAELRSLLRR